MRRLAGNRPLKLHGKEVHTEEAFAPAADVSAAPHGGGGGHGHQPQPASPRGMDE